MANRISKKLVTFAFPFKLAEIDEELPPGGYTIESENQDLDGSTFTAHRLIETVIVLRPPAGSRKPVRFVDIDPNGLAAALALDKSRSEAAAAAPEAETIQLARK